LLSFDEDSFDQLEHFMPLAKWASKNRHFLAAEEFQAIQKRSGRVVKSETNASFSPNMESIWTEMKERAEELQELLSVDLRREIETIEREIENADPPESSSTSVGHRIQHPAGSTIESIFEALIEQ
jgi:hypothetical protein